MRVFAFRAMFALAICSVSLTNAQDTSAATGTDMWTGLMTRQGMFLPHQNNCSANEAFVRILVNGRGFCIEKQKRSAQTWEEARHACLTDRKRLPEVGEWKFSCKRANALGLLDMIGPGQSCPPSGLGAGCGEWSSNFLATGNSGTGESLTVPYAGGIRCDDIANGIVGSNQQTELSRAFRCVR